MPDENIQPKDVKEMVGDFLRETAALVLVFSFLDKLVTGGRITAIWSIATVSLSVFLVILGIGIERSRQ
jgi:hypothetical protein